MKMQKIELIQNCENSPNTQTIENIEFTHTWKMPLRQQIVLESACGGLF